MSRERMQDEAIISVIERRREMSIKDVWFSHREEIFEVKNGRFSWTGKERIWDWNDCSVSFVRTIEHKLRVIVRSNANINSMYMGKYLFTWGKIPNDDKEKEKLLNYLKNDFKIDWVDNAEISKNDIGSDTIVIVSSEGKRAEIILDKNNDGAVLIINEDSIRREESLQAKEINDDIDIYRGKPVELRYMLGFDTDAEKILEPWAECYIAKKYKSKKKYGPMLRWVFQLDKKHWVWEWAKEGGKIENSKIYMLYKVINEEISFLSMKRSNIFEEEFEYPDDRIIPVIYQPAVDALENFIREIHCAQKRQEDGSIAIEVSVVFNNEQLRKNFLLQKIYEWLRKNIFYGRKEDIETFLIIDEKEPLKFEFKKIYSKKDGTEYDLKRDDIHGDNEKHLQRHDIKYYFMNPKHPVVFVNTSNHALAEDSANERLWAWEYIPWLTKSAVKLGDKTREKLDEAPDETSSSC